ncbi:3-dehydroquinate synthase [Benzoatithermus flavus]|uniref:3-dehydroquinate synthase n=1 Tax=Benzoatithermus flavus TaxID=3108223 RepID=A0ABU8XUH4_9PROT
MSAANVLRVALGERSYDIVIGEGLLDRAGELLASVLPLRHAVIVTDGNLARTRHPDRLAAGLERAGISSRRIVLPAGEGSKSWPVLEGLVDDLLAHGLERRSSLVALGGGVIGDLVGFAAAIALRGIDYVQIPTTLLSQVDSAVGGKTGINSRHGKNLIGAFHQPKAVLIDTSVLDDLPVRELEAGYAEVVKYGFIKDRSFFAWLEEHGKAVLAGDASARAHAIRRSLEVKAAVVAADERETSGERALLNFGHTFGHAYEALAGYDGGLLHGQAVSIGMVDAFALSARLGHCPQDDAERAEAHLARLGLPTRITQVSNRPFPVDELLAAMGRDKKVENARLRFVLVRGIGDAFTSADVPETAVRAVLAEHG